MKVLWSWLLELCDLDQRADGRGGRARAHARRPRDRRHDEPRRRVLAASSSPRSSASGRTRNADKLTLVDVITERGGAATQVVCGAPNVPEPGRKVLWAQVGASCPAASRSRPKAGEGHRCRPACCAPRTSSASADDHARHHRARRRRRARALGAPAQQRARHRRLAARGQRAGEPRRRARPPRRRARAASRCSRGKLVLPDADLSAYAAAAGRDVEIAIATARGCPRYVARVIDGLRVGPSPRRIAQRLRARRRAPDLEPRRRHELRDVRARPAAARVRCATR